MALSGVSRAPLKPPRSVGKARPASAILFTLASLAALLRAFVVALFSDQLLRSVCKLLAAFGLSVVIGSIGAGIVDCGAIRYAFRLELMLS